MFRETNNNFGVNEVLLSSVLAAVMFSLFAGQPLCIVGVTGMSPLMFFGKYKLNLCQVPLQFSIIQVRSLFNNQRE